MLGLHRPGHDGSWSFGYDYVCGSCCMPVGRWSDEKRLSVTAAINKLPEEQRQRAAARSAGGA